MVGTDDAAGADFDMINARQAVLDADRQRHYQAGYDAGSAGAVARVDAILAGPEAYAVFNPSQLRWLHDQLERGAARAQGFAPGQASSLVSDPTTREQTCDGPISGSQVGQGE